MESSFYNNVFLLKQAATPSKDVLKYFKEGMFDKPNTEGFLHLSHYLLSIYDAGRTKKLLKWPLYCKKDVSDYRTNVKDFLTSVANENPDIGFPKILASHLLHASGSRFSWIMWNLSTLCLRTYIRRETAFAILAPKTGFAEDLSKILLNNTISQSERMIKELDTRMETTEKDAQKYANEIAESIKKLHEDLLLTRQILMDLAAQSVVHPALKIRLANSNDMKVMQVWRISIEESFAYFKTAHKKLREIVALSNSVAAIVTSIAASDTNMLDGNLLPKIEMNALSEIVGLDPETQESLHCLHPNGLLSIDKLLDLFNQLLSDYHRYLQNYGLPDLSACKEQIHVSSEDMKSMIPRLKTLCNSIVNVSSEIKNGPSHKNDQNTRRNLFNVHTNDNIFHSVLLKSSPTININGNQASERTDVNDRLELTPVENMHKALFSRHSKNDDNTQLTKLGPKLFVSRINLDETSAFGTNERILSPVNRSTTSRLIKQSMIPRSGKYSHLFSSFQSKSSNRSNASVISAPVSSRNSQTLQASTTTNLYDICELRPHLTVPKNKVMENRDASTPKKCNANRGSSYDPLRPLTVTDDEKYIVKMISKMAINKKLESKDRTRRTSISDLVEPYKMVRENRLDEIIHLENSSDVSDESVKH